MHSPKRPAHDPDEETGLPRERRAAPLEGEGTLPGESIAALNDAKRLIELGARTVLICRVTGLPRKTVLKLVRTLTGRPAPGGQMPFTGAWYLESDSRMLHAALVYRLNERLGAGRTPSRLLLDVFDAYRAIVETPLLDITRVAHVPRLVTKGLWEARRCERCETRFIAPAERRMPLCPGCRLYYRRRCTRCGVRIEYRYYGVQRLCETCQAKEAEEEAGA